MRHKLILEVDTTRILAPEHQQRENCYPAYPGLTGQLCVFGGGGGCWVVEFYPTIGKMLIIPAKRLPKLHHLHTLVH